MWKKLTLWILSAVIAVAVGRFLILVATAYGLPSWFAAPEPSAPMFAALFGLILIGVAGADIVRYFVRAGVRSPGWVRRR